MTSAVTPATTAVTGPAGIPFRLRAGELKPLLDRSDANGLRRAGAHLAAIGATGMAVWLTLGTPWVVPLVILHGYLMAFLFSAEHETAHQTAFRSRALNTIIGHFAGFLILLPYEYYRVFHWDHHRYTQDPQRDPELVLTPPTGKLGLAWFFLGGPFWRNRARVLFKHALTGRVTAPWVPPEDRPGITREARFYIFGYVLILAGSIALKSWAAVWLWIVPVIVGHWFLRPYLLAEHTGCAHSTNMLENTRTTYTNAFVRFFAWNMPYHAEHHAYPAVPFHALPKLHDQLAPHLVVTARGYRAAAVDVWRFLRRTQTLPKPSDNPHRQSESSR